MTDHYGLKQPPHNLEAEQAVLSCIIADNRVLFDLDDILSEDMFYRPGHRIIFNQMGTMALQRYPIDGLSLIDSLDEAGKLDQAGGMEYVAEIASMVLSSGNSRHYATIIRDRAIQRQIITVGNSLAQMAFDGGDVQGMIDKAQTEVMGLTPHEVSETKTMREALSAAVDEVQRRHDAKGKLLGLTTGFKDLDRKTNGLKAGDLIVLAARPSMGKTTLAANMAESAALDGKLVIFFSLEMSVPDLAMRSMASVGRASFSRLQMGDVSGDIGDKITVSVSKMRDTDYYIDDNPRLTSAQILSRSRKIAQKMGKKPDLIVVDYLQLLSDKGSGDENLRITEASRNIKLTAREMDCPILLLSQLNRGVESRDDKRPKLSDLRSSGAIEQDADIVMMLYRDEVYNDKSERQGIADVMIRKNRNGETGTVNLASRLDICRFEDCAYSVPEYEPQKAERFEY